MPQPSPILARLDELHPLCIPYSAYSMPRFALPSVAVYASILLWIHPNHGAVWCPVFSGLPSAAVSVGIWRPGRLQPPAHAIIATQRLQRRKACAFTRIPVQRQPKGKVWRPTEQPSHRGACVQQDVLWGRQANPHLSTALAL